jgi:hypothetical protein
MKTLNGLGIAMVFSLGLSCTQAPEDVPLGTGDAGVEPVVLAAGACGGLLQNCCSNNKCGASNLTCKNKRCRLKDGQGCDLEDAQCASGHCNKKFRDDDLGVCGPCGKPNSDPDELFGTRQACCGTTTCNANAVCTNGGQDGDNVCECGQPANTPGFETDPINDPNNEPCCGGTKCNDDGVCRTNRRGKKVCVFCGEINQPCCLDFAGGCSFGTCRSDKICR